MGDVSVLSRLAAGAPRADVLVLPVRVPVNQAGPAEIGGWYLDDPWCIGAECIRGISGRASGTATPPQVLSRGKGRVIWKSCT